MGYGSIYEFEKEFVFEKGILTETKIYDNSKSRKSKYTENPELLKKYITDNINYSNITSEPFEKARVYVQILSVRLQRSWTLLFGVIYKKIADLVLR